MVFVFDTNVLISAALNKNSVADRAFEKARSRGIILTSIEVYAELKEVIHRSKFDPYLKSVDRTKFLTRYIAEATTIIVTHKVSVCRDEINF